MQLITHIVKVNSIKALAEVKNTLLSYKKDDVICINSHTNSFLMSKYTIYDIYEDEINVITNTITRVIIVKPL